MNTLGDRLIALQRQYFTDRKEICEVLCKLIRTPGPLRLYRVLSIYGPGGIGKSMLMREFRDICCENGIASSLASMDVCDSPVDLLTALRKNWELCLDDGQFHEFDSLLTRFQELYWRLQKEDEAGGKLSKVLGGVAGDVTAASVGAGAAGLVLGPLGALIGAAGGALAKSILDSSLATLQKNGLISRRDANFLTHLLPDLVSAFVRGADELARENQSLVVILDTYEYAEDSTRLNQWIAESFLPCLSENTLVVVSGRNNLHGKCWQGYFSCMYQHRLQPFDRSDIVDYLTIRGASVDQSDAVYELTAGLPLGAALWADMEAQTQLGFPDLTVERRSVEVVKAVVDRLLEQLDDSSKQAIRICAIPRRFEESILNLLMPQHEAPLAYEQLRRYSSLFSNLGERGLSMHDEVRRYLLEDFRSRNVGRYRDLNVTVAKHYDQKAQGEVKYSRLWFGYRTEQVYHLLAAEKKEGFDLVNEVIDDAVQMSDASVLESLLKTVADLPAEQGRHWTTLLKGDIYYFHQDYERAKACFTEAETLSLPPIIATRMLIALCRTLWNLGEYQEALACGKRAQDACDAIHDRKGMVTLTTCRAWLYHELGFFDEAIRVRQSGLDIAKELQSNIEIAWALNGLGTDYLKVGNVRCAQELLQQALAIWNEHDHRTGRFFTLYHIGEAYADTGYLALAVDFYNAAINTQPGYDDEVQVLIRLGEAEALLGNFDEGVALLQKSREYARNTKKPIYEARAYLFLGDVYLRQGHWEEAQRSYLQVIELSQEDKFGHLRAKAFDGVLRACHLRHMPLHEIIHASDVLEAISKERSYRDLLADANLYRGLALLRNNEVGYSIDLESITSSFLQAMSKALQFNSYILDKMVGQIIEELQRIEGAMANEVFARLITRWQSATLDGRLLTEIESGQRERDGLQDHLTSVLNQLKRAVRS